MSSFDYITYALHQESAGKVCTPQYLQCLKQQHVLGVMLDDMNNTALVLQPTRVCKIVNFVHLTASNLQSVRVFCTLGSSNAACHIIQEDGTLRGAGSSHAVSKPVQKSVVTALCHCFADAEPDRSQKRQFSSHSTARVAQAGVWDRQCFCTQPNSFTDSFRHLS